MKIETDFIKKYKIKDINTRLNDKNTIPVKKVIQSANLIIKRTKDLNNYAQNSLIELKDYYGNNIIEETYCEYSKNNKKFEIKFI